ncbi:MAG: BON domain-containing protein [Pseudomonadota bacterium]
MKPDIQLQRDVADELRCDPVIGSGPLSTAVNDGLVTLGGTVRSYAEKCAAETAALRVAGVRDLRSELVVELPPRLQRPDADIAAAVRQALQWCVLLPPGAVSASVESALVTLDGEVDWDYQRSAAVRTVRDLAGIVGLRSRIRVKRTAERSVIQEGIHAALARQADRDARRVDVSVDGSYVTLRGTVRSWSERTAVACAAWASPGVLAVVNELTVTG